MSTREQAHQLVDTMNEDQLRGFISLFRGMVTFSANNERSEKERAYDEIRKLIHPVHELNYDKELAEYREEKYEK